MKTSIKAEWLKLSPYSLTRMYRMIYDYRGHYSYSKPTVEQNAPDNWGVYYCGAVNAANTLIVHYVGRAAGDNVSIKSRLSDHIRKPESWPDVSSFGFRICTTQKEAEDLEATEIQRLQPKYNQIGKTLGRTW